MLITKTVLIVEDNPITRRLARAALVGEGYAVEEAPTAAVALKVAGERPPDLVLLDLTLPDRDGFTLLAELCAVPGMSEVPFVAVSGFFSQAEVARASDAGFHEVLVKPVETSRLLQLVRASIPTAPTSVASRVHQVVVADDDPIQLKYTCVRLRAAGFTVAPAVDGQDALEQARLRRPLAVVSDILMPRLDGFGLCLAVRKDSALADLVVVLTTSTYVEDADRLLGEQVGADAFVLRTPALEQLIEALNGALARSSRPRARDASGAVEREYSERVVHQLERQVGLNAGLARRCTLQAAELSILGGVTEALATRRDVHAGLAEVLEQCLDAGGVSHGAIYLLDDRAGRIVTRIEVGGAGLDPAALDTLLGPGGLLRGVLERLEPAVLPSDEPALVRAGLDAGVAVPIAARGQRLGVLLLGSQSGRLAREAGSPSPGRSADRSLRPRRSRGPSRTSRPPSCASARSSTPPSRGSAGWSRTAASRSRTRPRPGSSTDRARPWSVSPSTGSSIRCGRRGRAAPRPGAPSRRGSRRVEAGGSSWTTSSAPTGAPSRSSTPRTRSGLRRAPRAS